jgi:two-component system cell cycle sensor histidine kinase/response regulator CckA
MAQFKSQMQMRSLNELLFHSIEERKKAEMQLSESERNFRTLTENTSDIIARHDDSMRFSYVNSAFEKAMNMPSIKILGNTMESFIDDPEKRNYYESILVKVFKSGISTHFEITINNPNRIFNWCMTTEFDKQGHVTSVISTLHDITELRDAQERLYQLEKMQAIGQLAGGIAHDFNNKLGAILGYADILIETFSDDDRRKKYVEAIIKASQFASDLTTQLLAYARKEKVKSIIIDMHQVLDDLVRFLESSFDKKIVIKTALCASSPFILGDPLLLKNAFLNVALNANDAMPEGGALSFETREMVFEKGKKLFDDSELAPGKYLQIRISDTGTGIKNEDIKRIFEPFFTTKEIGKGTGLGLPAVYGIVKSHLGVIDVESVSGKGVVFDIYIPLASTEVLLHQKEIQINNFNSLSTILVVDDNELIHEMAAEMLNKLGYNVIVCRSGNEAVKLYSVHSEKVDLVLIDIIMPGIDGYETYTQLKNINPWIKAYFISGYSVNEKTNRFLAEGVLGIIQKPFRIGEIKNGLAVAFHNSCLQNQ